MKKTIGIVGYDIAGKGFGAPDTYLEFISEFGKPTILMPDDDIRKDLDLLILPGGLDINPACYGEAPRFQTSNTDVFKQYFFDHKLKHYIEQHTPTFGICLGFQQLNVYFGGKLIQNDKWHPQSSDRWAESHEVYISKTEKFKVNSHHHQTVRESTLGEGLKAIAMYYAHKGAEGVVEAFQHHELPVAGVQWHPEEFYDDFSVGLINNLLNF